MAKVGDTATLSDYKGIMFEIRWIEGENVGLTNLQNSQEIIAKLQDICIVKEK